MAQSLGIVGLSWRGQRLQHDNDVKVQLPGFKKTVSPHGTGANWSNGFVQGKVSATIQMVKGMLYEEIFGGDEGELQVITDIGTIYVFPRAVITDRPEFGSAGGKTPVTWEMGEVEEIAA